MDLTPAQHVAPAPRDGWTAADVSDDERVDDEFIAEHAARVHQPLKPEDEKIYRVHDAGGVLRPGLTIAVNNTGRPEEML